MQAMDGARGRGRAGYPVLKDGAATSRAGHAQPLVIQACHSHLQSGSSQEFQISLVWVRVLALPCTASLSLGRLPHLSEPQFPLLGNGDINSTSWPRWRVWCTRGHDRCPAGRGHQRVFMFLAAAAAP